LEGKLEMTTKNYDMVVQNPESTVVVEFSPSKKRAEHYQSEAELEKEFIEQLELQAYDYLKITSEDDLTVNLRKQLELLNDYQFSDNEWETFFASEIANQNQSILEKTKTIQEDFIKNLDCDDGTVKNIYLLKKDNIHNNSLQVVNQYATNDGQRSNRYDVTVLVNGLPLIHVELKRRGVAIQEAFNQINRYQRESFWASSGLFEYIQIFVISNGTHTKYYSNTTRSEHIKEQLIGAKKKGKRSSNSFEFTSWWADHTNRPITDLIDFAKTFFAKHAILNILTKYCVFTSEQQLLVMRPYQIVATEKILNKIEVSTNYKQLGTIDAGGYVWHTTGSGKTLTSFKTAQLVSKLPYIDKVLFVVDRKDLDYQTMKEYDKFAKGSANSNTSTTVLKEQLTKPNGATLKDGKTENQPVLITTIQKLDRFIKKNKGHTIFDGHVVLIFDECHRSQFGDMHQGIEKAFKNYHLFGFTGTPIFAANSSSGGRIDLKTTQQAFGEKLHTYTIVDAIADKNVLPFKVDYVSTLKEAENIEDKKVSSIDREKALSAPERLENIVKYIREHFDQKTKRNSFYKLKERRLNGFNSIFAVSSIDVAKKYYLEFKKQLENVPSDMQLKVATIFSFSPNEEEIDGVADENSEDTSGLDASSRDFLDSAIKDYNEMFGTSYDTSAEKFQNYYKDVSKRVKDREIDVLIVVNMFLTGFDATTLNTLWVDKNLRLHGLLQAFSRTNRILNSIKTFGNIICFRNLEKATNESISLFGDKEASGIVLLKTFDEYYNSYTNKDKPIRGYVSLIEELQETYPIGERIISEQKQKSFIKLYGSILRLRNILSTFDEFKGKEILSERDIQDYHSMYIDLYNEFRKSSEVEKENINDDLVFEMELIKQIEINIDYIIELIKKYHEDHIKNKEILVDINKAIESSVELRNKKDLIEQFISSLEIQSTVDKDWQEFVEKKKIEELEQIIKDENLNRDNTYAFIKNSFRDGNISTTGTSLSTVLPPVSRFSEKGERTKKKETVIEKFTRFFDRFFGISNNKIE
jgi:type I restriction enzyme R subunit